MIARLRAWLRNFRRRPAPVPRWREHRGIPIRDLEPHERATQNDRGERWPEEMTLKTTPGDEAVSDFDDPFREYPKSLRVRQARDRADRQARQTTHVQPMIYETVKMPELRALLCAVAFDVVRDHDVTQQNFIGRLLAGLRARRLSATPAVSEQLCQLDHLLCSTDLRSVSEMYDSVVGHLHERMGTQGSQVMK